MDFHDKESEDNDTQRPWLHQTDIPSCSTRLLFYVEKLKHPKLFQKVQCKMAKLISRFTNNEECPFWPLFLWSCHWRPGAILSGQNTSQDRRGRGSERGREGGRQGGREGERRKLSMSLFLLNHLVFRWTERDNERKYLPLYLDYPIKISEPMCAHHSNNTILTQHHSKFPKVIIQRSLGSKGHAILVLSPKTSCSNDVCPKVFVVSQFINSLSALVCLCPFNKNPHRQVVYKT